MALYDCDLSTERHKLQNLVLDDYGVSFVINSGIWLVSPDGLNTLKMMKSVKKMW